MYKEMKHKRERIMILKIFVEDGELKELYEAAIEKHNNSLFETDYYNSGFDIFCPDYYQLPSDINILKIDFKIKCAASILNKDNLEYYTGYYMYPRSSLSKTPLRLANSVGIIDSGYRGNLIGMFDVKDNEDYKIDDYEINCGTRLLQICSPDLGPIAVELVDSLEELGITERGEGGFGSTGK